MSQVHHGIDYIEFCVTDLERSLASVRAAGGRITAASFKFPGGRRFHFLDPSGNELAVWSES